MKTDINYKEISALHSLRCFLNSLLREYKNFEISVDGNALVLMFDDCSVEVGLLYNSSIGRFSFKNEVVLKEKKAAVSKKINFEEFVSLTLEKLSSIYATNPESVEIFKTRVLESLHNVEENLKHTNEDLENVFEGKACAFKDIEQSLFLGHSFHPHPKNRDGFSNEDALIYSPESKGEFGLLWLLVKKEFLNTTASKKFNDPLWAKNLFLKDCGETEEVGYYPIPVHPWQMKHLLLHPEIIKHLENKNILTVDKGENSLLWSATSSLRSIYNKHADYMLKFSLSVRLTNSIRHLLPNEVIRGIQVFDVFQSPKMNSFKTEHPKFNVIFEPAFMAILDSKGEIINESIVSLRENSFKESKDQNKYVLAALLQDHPTAEISLVGSLLKKRAQKTQEDLGTLGKKWFELFLDYGVIPLLSAQAKYGVMLGAHQQNFIIELEESLPVHAYFRDCQGTGYSDLGFLNFSAEVETLIKENGNILDSHNGSSLFSYYLFINSTLNALSVLARDTKLPEAVYLKILKEKLIELKKTDIIDHSCIDYLLESEFLLQKGNFLCSIIDLNENTTLNPLAIYNEMVNPLKNI